jgi:hypothetical protein
LGPVAASTTGFACRFPGLHSPSGPLRPSGSKRSAGLAASWPAFRIRPIPFAPRCASISSVRFGSTGLKTFACLQFPGTSILSQQNRSTLLAGSTLARPTDHHASQLTAKNLRPLHRIPAHLALATLRSASFESNCNSANESTSDSGPTNSLVIFRLAEPLAGRAPAAYRPAGLAGALLG